MAIVGRIAVIILWCGLMCRVGGEKRKVTIAGPDMYKGKNVARDVLAPGEIIANVLDFGAKANGKTDSTEAFMDGWRKVCTSEERVRLYVPEGRFLVGSMIFGGDGCVAPLPMTIQVEGTIMATLDATEYVNGEWLIFEDLRGLKLIGGGTFDGQGQKFWPFNDCKNKDGGPKECSRLPSSLQFNKVHDAIVQGIVSINAQGFHIFVTNSANIRLRRLKIIAPDESPNTDGIHISHSDRIRISRTTIETGDDCVSIIQGVRNVTINRLTCGPGHGISIGSLGKYPDENEVKGIHVQNSIMKGTQNGLRIKTWPERYAGSASDISFTGITMENVRNPIIIDQEYECPPINCKKKPSLVQIKDVTFANIQGTSLLPIAVDMRCSKKFPCQNIRVWNIDLKHGTNPSMARCANVNPIYGPGSLMPPRC